MADDILGSIIFIGVQILAYIEYPLAYGVLYENTFYMTSGALVFFTVFFYRDWITSMASFDNEKWLCRTPQKKSKPPMLRL